MLDDEFIIKPIAQLIKLFQRQNGLEYALSYFNEEVSSYCGAIDMLDCLTHRNGLNQLAEVFYDPLYQYDYATKIYQHLIDQSNLLSFDNEDNEEAIAWLHIHYFKLGLMNLKKI